MPQRFWTRLTLKIQVFDADHKDIDLLRLKSFTLTRKLEDREVLGQQGLARISELIATLVPFVSQTFYLLDWRSKPPFHGD